MVVRGKLVVGMVEDHCIAGVFLISSSLVLALHYEVAEAVRVPELRGRPVPGLDVQRGAVRAGPAQHLHMATYDSFVASVDVPGAALGSKPLQHLDVPVLCGT